MHVHFTLTPLMFHTFSLFLVHPIAIWKKLHNFWCCTYLTDIDSNIKEWPLPKHRIGHFEFTNSCGLRYEAEEFRRCINEQLIECATVSHEESLRIARIQDEIRRQIGMRFDVDDADDNWFRVLSRYMSEPLTQWVILCVCASRRHNQLILPWLKALKTGREWVKA